MFAPSIGESAGSLDRLIVSFGRHLRAANLAPRTVQTYLEGCRAFENWLESSRGQLTVHDIRKEDVEGFMEHLLERWKPATANNRYRALQQFFRFLEDEGDVLESPMKLTRPPKVPESLPAILTEDDLTALIRACAG